jgi:phage terminase large subunit-like protein
MTESDSTTLKWPVVAGQGYPTPRLTTQINDLPSKGQEMIDFCAEIGYPLLPWQEYVAIHAHKVKPDGRWAHSEVGLLIARQNGKSTFMALRILTGIYLWGEKLQVATAHKLTTSSEIFYKIDEMIQSNPRLVSEFFKKYESKGSQEMRFNDGSRYLVRANNSAARGIAAPDTIHLDEVREYKDDEVWSSMRYTQMASKNPQVWIYSNAGDQHSVVLNKLRDRAMGAMAGSEDTIAWFEWSAIPGADIHDMEAWRMANPSLGHTIHPDNLRAAMNDEESIVRTELLCQWVSQINPAINPTNWEACADKTVKLDKEQETWMAIDLSPDRKAAALIGAQHVGDKFVVALLHTWSNPVNLDDKQIANDVADYVRKYQTQTVAYSRQTSGAVAARLAPAGINTTAIDGAVYGQACDEMLSAITSGRLIHGSQDELNRQVLSAVKLPFKDGGWYLGRKASSSYICATVAMAMVSHFATRPETELDIYVG